MSDRKRNRYPLEFKESSAKLALDSSNPVTQTAKELGIHPVTLHSWIKKFYPNKSTQPISQDLLQEENHQLKRENARLKQERDILKKAAAYFAREE